VKKKTWNKGEEKKKQWVKPANGTKKKNRGHKTTCGKGRLGVCVYKTHQATARGIGNGERRVQYNFGDCHGDRTHYQSETRMKIKKMRGKKSCLEYGGSGTSGTGQGNTSQDGTRKRMLGGDLAYRKGEGSQRSEGTYTYLKGDSCFGDHRAFFKKQVEDKVESEKKGKTY